MSEQNTGKVRPAPTHRQIGVAHSWSSPIFTASDVQAIVDRVNAIKIDRGPTERRDGTEEALVDGLNEAALAYFAAAREAHAGSYGEFQKWAERVARTSAAFLDALGIEADARTIPLPALVALISHNSGVTTAKRYPPGFDYKGALDAAVQGAMVARDLAEYAAGHYQRMKDATKPKAGVVRARTAPPLSLSPRQILVGRLGKVFEQCFDAQMPKTPAAGASPFLRFAHKVCRIVGERMVAPAEQMTVPKDGSDYSAAHVLRQTSETSLAEDVRAMRAFFDNRAKATAFPVKP